MRILSPALTIPVGATQPSNAADIGHHKVVGLVILSTGTGATGVQLQELVDGQLGQGNEVWRTIIKVAFDGTATQAQEVDSIAQGAYHFDEHYTTNLPVVRLISVGTLATAAIVAKLILEPHH